MMVAAGDTKEGTCSTVRKDNKMICIASLISSFVGIDLNFAKVPVTHDKFATLLLSLFVLEIYEKQSLITFCKSMQ